MKKFILLLLLSFSVNASESVMIEKGVYTKHLPSHYPYNNDNKMIALEYNKDKWYFNVSYFDNSFYRKSITLGSGYKVYSVYGFNLDLLFGAATGYDEAVPGMKIKMPCIDFVCFYVAPRISYGIPLTDHVYFTQSVKVFGTAAEVGLGLKYEF